MTEGSTTAEDAPAVVAVGNALIDRTYLLSNLPEPDGGAYVESSDERPGGVEANVAAVLAALGNDAGVIARLGEDDVADQALADLDDREIDRRRVRTVAGEQSAYCLVLRDGAGRRMIVGGGESIENLRLDDDDLAYLAGTDAVFASGYVPAPVIETLAEAREAGHLSALAFDLAGERRELQPRGVSPGVIETVLPRADLFVGNEAAVGSYVDGDASAAMIEDLRSLGVTRGAITRGPDGAVLFDTDDRVVVPALDVDVTDTTGAGDAFTAGLIDAWVLADEPMEQAGRFAAATAALNCTTQGARGRLPSRSDVRGMLEQRDS